VTETIELCSYHSATFYESVWQVILARLL